MQQEEITLCRASRTQAYASSVRRTVASIYADQPGGDRWGSASLPSTSCAKFACARAMREQIRQREEWFRMTLTSIGDGVIATDEKGRVTFINPVAEQLTGTTLAQCKGRDVRERAASFQ